MSPLRLGRMCVLVVAAASALGCDPLEEGAPPASPPPISHSSASAAPSLEESAPGAPAGSGDSAGPRYASDEVTLGSETDGYDDDDPAALTDFRAILDGHGTWVDDAAYGTVWVPAADAVGPDFQPYVTAGHWVYESEWVWASDFGWGWGPFHYGRWVWIPSRGWAWIPGRTYRGAWVAWGADEGGVFLGWAPLAPTFVWFGGVPVAYAGYAPPRWTYCPRRDVFAPRLGARVVAGPEVLQVGARVRPISLANPGVGPAPMSLGFRAEDLTHANGPDAAGVARAREFSVPSTAASFGGRPPVRAPVVVARPVVPTAALPPSSFRAPSSPPRVSPSPVLAPPSSRTYAAPRVAPRIAPAPAPMRVAPAPMRVAPAPVAPRPMRVAPAPRR